MMIGKYLLKNHVEEIILAITGNGRTDLHILDAFAKKYNGMKKFIWTPTSSRQKKTGLKALDAIKYIVSKYKIENFIYLVDKEHVKDKDDILQYLSKFLRNVSREGHLITANYGSHSIRIYTVIFGEEKCIEEEIAKLIKIRYSMDITPDKKEIKKFLREKKTWYDKLIEVSTKNELRESFPNLSEIMQKIEEDP